MTLVLAGGGLLGAFAMARRKRPEPPPKSFAERAREAEEAGDLERAWDLRIAAAIVDRRFEEARALRRAGPMTNERLGRIHDFHRRIDRED